MRRINEELEEEIDGPKPRKPTSMERLQTRRVMVRDKGNWKEVEQVEMSMSWKQSVRSAARKRNNQRNKEIKQHIACRLKGPWCKRDPPSDDESHGDRALPAYEAVSAAITS